jgi:hypothetical protein
MKAAHRALHRREEAGGKIELVGDEQGSSPKEQQGQGPSDLTYYCLAGDPTMELTAAAISSLPLSLLRWKTHSQMPKGFPARHFLAPFLNTLLHVNSLSSSSLLCHHSTWLPTIKESTTRLKTNQATPLSSPIYRPRFPRGRAVSFPKQRSSLNAIRSPAVISAALDSYQGMVMCS